MVSAVSGKFVVLLAAVVHTTSSLVELDIKVAANLTSARVLELYQLSTNNNVVCIKKLFRPAEGIPPVRRQDLGP